MARWRLTEKHYLHTIPPTEWEQKEVDLETGEEARKRYEVPRLLDPERRNKRGDLIEAIVCYEGKGLPGDVTIKGAPTASMEPLDDEAKEISAKTQRGAHPIESLPAQGDAPPGLLQQMQAQLNALMMANDDLHRRLSAAEKAAEGDVLKDIEDLASQQVPLAKDQTKPMQRRL